MRRMGLGGHGDPLGHEYRRVVPYSGSPDAVNGTQRAGDFSGGYCPVTGATEASEAGSIPVDPF